MEHPRAAVVQQLERRLIAVRDPGKIQQISSNSFIFRAHQLAADGKDAKVLILNMGLIGSPAVPRDLAARYSLGNCLLLDLRDPVLSEFLGFVHYCAPKAQRFLCFLQQAADSVTLADPADSGVAFFLFDIGLPITEFAVLFHRDLQKKILIDMGFLLVSTAHGLADEPAGRVIGRVKPGIIANRAEGLLILRNGKLKTIVLRENGVVLLGSNTKMVKYFPDLVKRKIGARCAPILRGAAREKGAAPRPFFCREMSKRGRSLENFVWPRSLIPAGRPSAGLIYRGSLSG